MATENQPDIVIDLTQLKIKNQLQKRGAEIEVQLMNPRLSKFKRRKLEKQLNELIKQHQRLLRFLQLTI